MHALHPLSLSFHCIHSHAFASTRSQFWTLASVQPVIASPNPISPLAHHPPAIRHPAVCLSHHSVVAAPQHVVQQQTRAALRCAAALTAPCEASSHVKRGSPRNQVSWRLASRLAHARTEVPKEERERKIERKGEGGREWGQCGLHAQRCLRRCRRVLPTCRFVSKQKVLPTC